MEENEFNLMMQNVVTIIEAYISNINESDSPRNAEAMIIHPTSCNQLEEYLYPGDPVNWSEDVYFTFPAHLDQPIQVFKSTQIKQGEIRIY